MLLLGVLAAQAEAAAPAAAGSYDLLETEILTGSEASVTFDSLNSTYGADYQHLQIRIVVRSAVSESASQIALYLNGDTSSANYAFHQLYGNGSTVGSEGYGSGTLGQITPIVRTFGATGTADAFGAGVVDILDSFETSKYTTVRSLHGAAGVNAVGLTSGLWMNTNAVDSITILKQGGGDLATASRFSLYGLKASA
jgi:hypothetical protein